MAAKICVVTGASSGIGREVAIGLAKAGAVVVIVCRDRGRAEQTAAEVRRHGPAPLVLLGDLARTSDVRRVAEELRKAKDHVDVLVLNAGVVNQTRRVTPDGLEETFAVNHLAPFLLTSLVQDLVRERVLVVASQVEKRGRIAWDDLQSERGYDPLVAYNQSKLANVMFTYALARRLEPRGVRVNCVHPGVIATNLLASYLGKGSLGLRERLTTPGPATAARAIVKLALDESAVTGAYFHEGRRAESSAASHDRDAQERLWKVSEELVA